MQERDLPSRRGLPDTEADLELPLSECQKQSGCLEASETNSFIPHTRLANSGPAASNTELWSPDAQGSGRGGVW